MGTPSTAAGADGSMAAGTAANRAASPAGSPGTSPAGNPGADTAGVVRTARRALGRVGVLLPVSFTSTPPVAAQQEAARRLESAGYGAAWTNEVIGKDALVQLSLLLAATGRMAFGTAVANIWAREPQTLHAAAAQLAQAHPGRLVLGMGVGYPQQAAGTGREFGRPLATMRGYLERMDGATSPPAPAGSYPRIVGANGPRMLALAGESADGALPLMVPARFTARAREVLGPDKLLVVGLSVVLGPDREKARLRARETVAAVLERPQSAAALARLGFRNEEVASVSDRLVDAIVAHGGPDAVAAAVHDHLAAGADHVVLMVPSGGEFTAGVDQLTGLASELPLA